MGWMEHSSLREVDVISIGVVIGGPECKEFEQVLMDLACFCPERDEDHVEPPVINLVYHLSGSVMSAEHRGLRTAKFSQKKKISMIQIGLSRGESGLQDCPSIIGLISETARDGIFLAGKRFRKAGIEFDPEADLALLEHWQRHARMAKPDGDVIEK